MTVFDCIIKQYFDSIMSYFPFILHNYASMTKDYVLHLLIEYLEKEFTVLSTKAKARGRPMVATELFPTAAAWAAAAAVEAAMSFPVSDSVASSMW